MSDIAITPRERNARHDLEAAWADIQVRLLGISGLQWRCNDRGAQAVIVSVPEADLARVRALLQPFYMVDSNPPLHL
ncbi:hypothetical protein E7V67_016200 [[Empedobacter] haloabium]|uniref:Muconolactone isomerase domain-containing protein n=1 Tax=[Empedobacter] haloabium TaxID=592317 RepID=A0ABZ1UGH3_9BURK